MLVHHSFNFGRPDLESGHIDHALQPIRIEKVAVFVVVPKIACAKKRLAIKFDKGVARGLFVLPTTAILFWSPPKIGTGVFGVLILSELVVGVISAALLTDETFGWPQAVGATLIVFAGIIEVAMSSRSNKTTAI